LRKIFKSGSQTIDVLDDISFQIEPGSACAIVGPSGSGKTTLIAICAGLERPTSGSVILNGTAVHEASEDGLARLRNHEVGFIFQSFQLLPTLTALENVMVPAEIRGENHTRGRATELLKQVSLGDRLDHYPIQLSGGEQQRVAIARAIAARPRIVLMDEPFGALDPLTRDTIGTAYRALHERLALTTVMVTHDMQDAILLADRITVMSAGQIVANDTPISLMGSIAAADTPPEVAALLAMPKRRAERISAIMTRDTKATGRSHE
jgi:putative ABC transport system ATP-binding protein